MIAQSCNHHHHKNHLKKSTSKYLHTKYNSSISQPSGRIYRTKFMKNIYEKKKPYKMKRCERKDR